MVLFSEKEKGNINYSYYYQIIHILSVLSSDLQY